MPEQNVNPERYPQYQEEELSSFFDLKNLTLKLVLYWPWFVVSIIACIILALVYLRFQVPEYSINGSVIIKEDKTKGRSASIQNASPMAVMDLGSFSMTNNFNNEVEILQSRTLIKKVVSNLGLYINTMQKFHLRAPRVLYNNSPVSVWMTPDAADAMRTGVVLEMTYHNGGAVDVEANYTYQGEKVKEKKHIKKLPALLTTKVGVISLAPNTESITVEDQIDLLATISSPTNVAGSYKARLSVQPASKTTTIANLVLKDADKTRAIDFLNKLIEMYNQDANDEKNEVAEKTADFIAERINIINNELSHEENRLASFKQTAGLTNLTNDAQLALTENSRYEQERIQNSTQISLVEYLQNYVNDPANDNEVIPANIGLQDANLSNVITQYNTQLLEKKRLMRTSNEANPNLQLATQQVELLRNGVKTTIESVLKGLRITQK